MLKFGINKRTGCPLDNKQFREFEAHESGKVVSHNHWPHLPPENMPVTQEAESTPGP